MFTSDIIKKALEEDLGTGDRTSEAIIPPDVLGTGTLIAKQDLVAAGLGVAGGVFLTVDRSLNLSQKTNDGSPVKSGSILMEVKGNCRSILAAERVALNFLQRMSGIATLTRSYVEKTAGTKTKILDTRKTLPLMRHLDKYAVRMGGGFNHRQGLFDAIMIKDNHLAVLKGGLKAAIRAARERNAGMAVIVEATSLKTIKEAQEAGATRILLDNMPDAGIEEAMKTLGKGVEVEVSGGITLDRIACLSKLGVQYISVGRLTHSAPAADISLELAPE